MKKSLLLIAAVCAAGASQATTWDLTAVMDNVQAGVTGHIGVGVFQGSYDDVTNQFSVITMQAFFLTGDVAASHVHLGSIGNTGSVIINFADLGSWSSGTNPVFTPNGSTATVNESDEAALLSQGTYINVHTAAFPGGEIRGQIQSQAVPEPATFVALGLAAAAFLRRKRA